LELETGFGIGTGYSYWDWACFRFDLVPLPRPLLPAAHNFNEHARTQLKSKQIYYAPFEQRINFNPCAEEWVKESKGGMGERDDSSQVTADQD